MCQNKCSFYDFTCSEKSLSAIFGFWRHHIQPHHRISEGVAFHIDSSLKRSAHTYAYQYQNRCSFNDFTCSEKSLSANPDLKIKCKGNCLKVNWSGAKLIVVTPGHYIIFNNFRATHTLIIGFVIFFPPFLSHSGRRHSTPQNFGESGIPYLFITQTMLMSVIEMVEVCSMYPSDSFARRWCNRLLELLSSGTLASVYPSR